MARGLFVTGTDTGVGKTRVASALLHALAARGLAVAGLKPVAAGAEATPAGLRNEDALALMAAASVQLPYEQVNPYCFAPPVAPHLAAADAGVHIDLDVLLAGYREVAARCDAVVVEGAGGFLVPLDAQLTTAVIPALLSLEVVLVVGLRLGCINHALLTAVAIERKQCRAVGWVGSVVDPQMLRIDDNIAALRERLPVPCLGVLPHEPGAGVAANAARLDLRPLGYL